MDECFFGEAAEAEPLKQPDPIAAQARRFGRSAQCRRRMSALEGSAGQTPSARPACLGERTHDVISNADLRYVGADCRHNPGDLVTKHSGRRNEIVSSKEQVSVTQPGRLYVYENFVTNGRGDVHILEVEPTTDSVEYKRLHVRPPYSRFEPTWRSKAAGRAMDWRFAGLEVGQFSRIGGLTLVIAAVHVRGMSLK